MASLIRDLVTYPCQDACGERETSRRVEGAPVYRCPGCDSEWILLNERTTVRSPVTGPDAPSGSGDAGTPATRSPSGATAAAKASGEEARALLDRAHRVLFVHAHPDDETIATGALIAHLARQGKRVAVLTATRGERGAVVPGSVPAGLSAGDLAAHREGELEAACRTLGVAEGAFLGEPPARAPGRPPRRYTDGGMRWLDEAETVAGPGDDAGPDALTRAELEEVAADIAAFAAHVDADVLVTYDEHGGYGHPDHVATHHATRRAAVLAGRPLVVQVSRAEGPVTYDLPETLAVVSEALRRHATQLTVDGDDLVHVGGQRQPIVTSVALRLERV